MTRQLTPKLTHSRWQRARACNDSSRAGRNRQTESLSGCCVQRLVRHEDIHTAIHSRTHPQTLATQPPLGTRGGKTVRMVAGVCWHVACPAGAMTAHACGDAFTSERLPTLRSARLSKALTPPATLDNSLISAFLPNDQAQAQPLAAHSRLQPQRCVSRQPPNRRARRLLPAAPG